MQREIDLETREKLDSESWETNRDKSSARKSDKLERESDSREKASYKLEQESGKESRVTKWSKK